MNSMAGSMEPVISESELALFRFNYESIWDECVQLIREGKLRVVEDTGSYELPGKDSDKNVSG